MCCKGNRNNRIGSVKPGVAWTLWWTVCPTGLNNNSLLVWPGVMQWPIEKKVGRRSRRLVSLFILLLHTFFFTFKLVPTEWNLFCKKGSVVPVGCQYIPNHTIRCWPSAVISRSLFLPFPLWLLRSVSACPPKPHTLLDGAFSETAKSRVCNWSWVQCWD